MEVTPAERLRQIAAASVRDRVLIKARWGVTADVEETADKVAALLDVARVLDAAGAPYALIGGVAVGIHAGVPRATLDIDVAVVSTSDRASTIGAMAAAGFRLVGEHAHSANFRHASGEPVQLFDVGFDDMILRAEPVAVGSTTVRIVRKDDLIAMKQRAAADPARHRSKALRDQADVALPLGDVPDPDEGW